MEHAEKFFPAVDQQNANEYFIFIGPDSMTVREYGPGSSGLFGLEFTLGSVRKDFEEHFYSLFPGNNPWMKEYWAWLYNCQWNVSTGPFSCSEYANRTLTYEPMIQFTTKYHDGINVFAQALHDLINDTCPLAFEDKVLLRSCIDGETLLAYMKNVIFKGVSGKIAFDENGDLFGKYDIKQYVHGRQPAWQKVGEWNKENVQIIFNSGNLRWDIYRKTLTGKNSSLIRSRNSIPESTCNRPCKKKEYRVQLDKCCYQCLSCRNNEYINGSACVTCPETFWPDEHSATTCIAIPATYMKVSDTFAIGIQLLASVGLALILFIAIAYYRNRGVRLLKASSLELSSIIFTGILVAFMAAFTFVMKPQQETCLSSYFGFNIATNLIYVPLFIKTLRVYRIFSCGKKGVKKLKWISSSSQLLMSSAIILGQVWAGLSQFLIVIGSKNLLLKI